MTKIVESKRKVPKRESTLEKILTASRNLFYEKGFHESSVEDIAKNSGIQRATFYLYYRKKEDIIVDLVKDDLKYQIEQYRKLATISDINQSSVEKWLIEFRTAFEERRRSIPLYTAATDLSSEIRESVDLHRKEIIEVLGSRFVSFDLDALARADRPAQCAKCYVVIFMIESCMNTFSRSPLAPTFDDGLELLTNALCQFLTDGTLTV